MIHFVVGTRAQFFKMAPVMLECQRRGLQWQWIHAAQHRQTMASAETFFGIPPAHSQLLQWESEAKSIARFAWWSLAMGGKLLRARRVLAPHHGKQHIVLTHGDTTTTVVGALLGKLSGTRVMHVESGLRSHNLFKPFPEELNRLATFSLSDFYACPGDHEVHNLKKHQGIKINTGGNTQIDTLRFGLDNLHKANIELPAQPYAVMSFHRFENLFNARRLQQVVDIALSVASRIRLLIPLHPVTEKRLRASGLIDLLRDSPNIDLLPRLDYVDYLKAINHCEFALTDGGGNQEELSYLGKPTLLLRSESERSEGLGKNAIVSRFDPALIEHFITHYQDHICPPLEFDHSPSSVIVDRIESYG